MTITSTTQEEYILNRDFLSAARLNYQHFLIKQQLGFLLHPDIPKDQKDLKVLDVGSGTCIWPIELSDQLPPTACIDAMDISLKQAPMKDRLPQTVRLIEQDIYSPLPEDMVGKYDIVHVQLFLLCVKDNDPIPLIQKFIQLLKPGGYLHWVEVDPDASQTVKTVRSSSSTEATEELMDFLSKPRDSKGFGWISQLESVFIREGLAAVTVGRTRIAESYQAFWNANYLMLGEEFSSLMLHGTPSAEVSQKATRLREATSGASVEMQNGVAIRAELILAVGRKPLSHFSLINK